MDEELLPIGQFARLGRLSIKQLRHYAELGLLVPAYVDEHTGYRYYRHEQARDALSIGLLRSLDVPLAVIAQVLSDTEGLPSTPVTVATEPARRVAVATVTAADPEGVGRATSAAIARLRAASSAAAPELIGLFPLDLCEPVAVSAALVSEEPVAGTELNVLPGGRFAGATHVGPYGQIGLTAHALLSWCAERRCPVRGPIREVYVSDPATTPPDRLITHLMIPLEEL